MLWTFQFLDIPRGGISCMMSCCSGTYDMKSIFILSFIYRIGCPEVDAHVYRPDSYALSSENACASNIIPTWLSIHLRLGVPECHDHQCATRHDGDLWVEYVFQLGPE
jgi:hypothetical protein